MRPIRAAAAALVPSLAFFVPAVPAWASGGAPPPAATQTVSCSAAALITAIDRANASGGGDLTLTRGCRYTLTSAQPGTEDGLPPIRSTITTNGNGATITRPATPPRPTSGSSRSRRAS